MAAPAPSAAANEVKPRGRRFRFGLKSLFVVVTLLCLVLGWGGSILIRTQRQRSYARHLLACDAVYRCEHEINGGPEPGPAVLRWLFGKDAFADVYYVLWWSDLCTDAEMPRLQRFPRLHDLRLISSNISDEGVKHVAQLPNLEILELTLTRVTHHGISDLSAAKKLKHLGLRGSRISDETLGTIDQLPQLESIELRETEVTSAGLAKLGTMPNLREVYLRHLPKVDDRGLAHLLKVSGLRQIGLNEVPISAGGLQSLAQLPQLETLALVDSETHALNDGDLALLREFPQLRRLSLESRHFTNQAIAHIAELNELRTLQLVGWQFNDQAAAEIARLQKLEELNLEETSISDDGLQQLHQLTQLKGIRLGPYTTGDGELKFRAALPGCKVRWHRTSKPSP